MNRRSFGLIAVFALFANLLTSINTGRAAPPAEVVDRPPTDGAKTRYPTSRAPLQPTPFVKLPVGSIAPGGWVHKTMELQRDGLVGRLPEISLWLSKRDNAWLSKTGRGEYGWEELPYWLKGYVRLGYALNDPALIAEAKTWIDGTIDSQRDDGDFGPIVVKGRNNRDLWAQMLMLHTLQSHFEATGDPRVLPLMTKYFQWQLTIADEHFLRDYWENSRAGDNLASVYWLYNRTGDKFLLDLATKIDRCGANWRQASSGKLPNWHGVNIAQCFREPATYWLQSGKKSDLEATEANFALVRELYGQAPGGLFAADENCRRNQGDPRQSAETCTMTELIGSDAMLLEITGDARWVENLEDVAYNTYPAAFMPDYRSLRYLTAPNLGVSDSKNHAPGFENSGPMLAMNPLSHRCCQHNHGSAWPNFLEATWMGTPDGGLAAQVLTPGRVKAKVGRGEATIVCDTRYPFSEESQLTVSVAQPTDFPLYVRIPTWAKDAEIKLNGERVAVENAAGRYVKLVRQWNHGDTLLVRLPMKVAVRKWSKNKDSVSVEYGPLTFSLAIKERYEKVGSRETATGESRWQPTVDLEKWPSFVIFPDSPWNVGLALDANAPERSFTVVRKSWPTDNYPFAAGAWPIELTAQGRVIPDWKLDPFGLVAPLPQSPVKSDEPVKPITLIPMGGARLRITAFPIVQ